MKSLVSHYQKIKDKLKSRLDTTNTVEEVLKIVLDEINQLTDLNGEYIKELTPPQARLARNMLQGMKENLQILSSVALEDLTVDVSEKSFDISEVQAELSRNINQNVLSPLNSAIQTQKNIQNWTSPNYYKQILLQPLQKSRVIISSLLAAGLAGTLEGGITWGLVGAVIGLITGGVFGKVVKQKQLPHISSNYPDKAIQN